VREGLDRVISVSYDADQGSSVVTQSENEDVGVGSDLRPLASGPSSRSRRRAGAEEDSVESAEAGAGAGA
jgi:hypothetical protein